MVFTRTTFHCGECRKTHSDYEAARDCEGQHIVDRAVSGFKVKLAEIFARHPLPIKAMPTKDQPDVG